MTSRTAVVPETAKKFDRGGRSVDVAGKFSSPDTPKVILARLTAMTESMEAIGERVSAFETGDAAPSRTIKCSSHSAIEHQHFSTFYASGGRPVEANRMLDVSLKCTLYK